MLEEQPPSNFSTLLQGLENDLESKHKDIERIRKQLFANKDEITQDEDDVIKDENDNNNNNDDGIDEQTRKDIEETKQVLQKSISQLQSRLDLYLASQIEIAQSIKHLHAFNMSVAKINDGINDIKFMKLKESDDAIANIEKIVIEMSEHVGNQYKQDIDEKSQKRKQLENIIKKTTIAYGLKTKLYHACPICFNNEITHFVGMCGHTYCANCIAKMRDCCFICNKYVTSINPLYSC